jgi:hypothetical protein
MMRPLVSPSPKLRMDESNCTEQNRTAQVKEIRVENERKAKE